MSWISRIANAFRPGRTAADIDDDVLRERTGRLQDRPYGLLGPTDRQERMGLAAVPAIAASRGNPEIHAARHGRRPCRLSLPGTDLSISPAECHLTHCLRLL